MGSTPPPRDITQLLHAWKDGAADARDPLLAAVVPELHRVAELRLSQPGGPRAVACEVLLDEAYRQLAAGAQPAASDQAQFRGFAAHTMRGVLVDHARALASGPLSAGTITITLPRNGAPPAVAEAEPDLLDLDRALGQLEQLDPLQSRVVELRYFGGLSIEGAAAALGIAADAAGREWVLGKTWIRRWLMERARGR